MQAPYALTVTFTPGETQLTIGLGGHEWVDAAVSGAIGLVAVPPVPKDSRGVPSGLKAATISWLSPAMLPAEVTARGFATSLGRLLAGLGLPAASRR
mgnify:CR=1 FL=1